VIKLSRRNALCAGILLAMTGSSFAADNGSERVWVKFTPGAKGNVENALRAAGGRVHHTFDDLGAFAVSVPSQALNGLRNNPNIEYIEEDVVRSPMAQTVPYGIPMVQAQQAWAAGGDGSGILVCVIDSGINANHEDFGNITGGYPSGWNSDTCGHGTHVAGSVGALDNSVGVVGVAPKTSFYIVQVFNGSNCGWSYSSTLIDAANRCANAGTAQGKRVVINMSLGGGRASTTEQNGFANLYNTGNVLSIAAAGNDGTTKMSYPASYDSVVSVAAIDSNKALASFSQRNSQVEIAAPGVDVLSTMPFSDASVVVSGQSFMVSPMEGSFQGSASAALADGGRCTSTNGAWSGKVVLCERGDISFANKNTNVQNSGGKATIVYNNEPGSFGGTLGGAASSIPSVAMAQEDGQFLKANRLGATANVSTVFQASNSAYGLMSGTSMASPHAAGAAAAIWSSNPAASNADVRSAMTSTAEDLGSAGRDNSFGYGLVRTASAIAALAGGGGTEPPPPPPGEDGAATVGSVAMSFSTKGKNYQASAAVSVLGDGVALSGASVSGCFSGAVSGCGTGTSNGNGQVTFTSGTFKTRASVSFCVTSISKDGYAFASGSNDCGSGTP
jgi:serine protease